MKVIQSGEPPERLADPADKAWQGAPAEPVPLAPAPAGAQPSPYVRAAWASAREGAPSQVEVSAARSATGDLFIRLQWDDPDEDRAHAEYRFPDAAAVMFPADADAPLADMGSPEHPVRLWYWRPDLEGECESLTATGLGTVERNGGRGLSARSTHESGRWTVVFHQDPSAASSGAGGQSGQSGQTVPPTKVAFAVWEGAAGERAGLKSVSQSFHELEETK